MILDNKLTNNTSKLIAFQNLGEEMNKTLDKDAKVNGCFGPSQIVNLRYTWETNILIEHELQSFEGKRVIYDSNNAVGDMQYTMVMSIELESKEKPICNTYRK